MKLFQLAALAAIGGALSGCASMVEGTTQNIAVTTVPVEGAKCVLTSSEGTYYVTTPGNTVVHKTKNSLNVVCRKDGFVDATKIVPSHFNGATVGNVLAGGIVGLAVDAATGANFNYPDKVDLPMTTVGESSAEALPATVPPPEVGSKPSS
jgi:hypothetical protein